VATEYFKDLIKTGASIMLVRGERDETRDKREETEGKTSEGEPRGRRGIHYDVGWTVDRRGGRRASSIQRGLNKHARWRWQVSQVGN